MVVDVFSLGVERMNAETLVKLSKTPNPRLKVDPKRWDLLRQQRQSIEKAIDNGQTIYGVNTGFGYLSKVRIPKEDIQALQTNLIRSHACGVGEPLPESIVRGMLILKAHNFLLGHSGIRRECVEALLTFLENDILPMVPSKGSVGASGDLAPLAHVAMALLGEGQVYHDTKLKAASEVLAQIGIQSFVPQMKEGLSLINGTQFMSVQGAHCAITARNLIEAADFCAALSLEGMAGTASAFDARIHKLRAHSGQGASAEKIFSLLEKNDAAASYDKVQDPYSFRCAPQVHGVARMTWDFVNKILETELNSVTDNPLVFDNGEVLSGGNFHGEPLACSFDYLCIALTELGNISERRIEKLTNPAMSGLPAFLTNSSGLSSGFMIPHVVSAALASENKVLSHPASVDTIPTSADKEDHVSMGAFAARKLDVVCKNVAHILAIEFLAACQAIDLQKSVNLSAPLLSLYSKIRSLCPRLDRDRSLHEEIEKLANLIVDGSLIQGVQQKV